MESARSPRKHWLGRRIMKAMTPSTLHSEMKERMNLTVIEVRKVE